MVLFTQPVNTSTRKRYTLPPRLTKQSEFRRAGRYGVRFRIKFLQITVAPVRNRSHEANEGRVGYTIPEKAVRRAVKRNRIRRLLKEATRFWWHAVKPGLDVVFSVKNAPDIDHANYVEVIMLKLFLKADILTDDGVILARKRLGILDADTRE